MNEQPCGRDPFRHATEESRELSEEEARHIAECPCCRKILEGEAAAGISLSLRRCLCHGTVAPSTLRTRIVQSLALYMQTEGMQIAYEEQRYQEDQT
ncbi:hypothetical protein [Varibaculum cambriense]|uniref:hypothetical protein n=1 Tax=Varibaculum cambriense TaxID=184870 RepID=UPI0025563287|nr:hypothetical protein [Varibaculum cambriense]MDK8273962.1 hypothetical protein [Varibaculum cambriense]